MLHEFLDILAAMVKLPYYSLYYEKMNKLREKLKNNIRISNNLASICMESEWLSLWGNYTNPNRIVQRHTNFKRVPVRLTHDYALRNNFYK
jgi:hypothetical protein